MTCRTICRELGSNMRRVGGLIVVVQMASDTGIGCVRVVVVVTADAFVRNGCVGSYKRIIIVVDGKGSRSPPGNSRVTIAAGDWYLSIGMIRVGGRVVSSLVAGLAGPGGICEIPARMAFVAIADSMTLG